MYCCWFFFLMILLPPRSTRTDTLFPDTTLFRSTSFDGVCRLAAMSAKAVSFVPINQAPRTTVKRQCFTPEQRGHFPHLWREDRAVGNVRVDLRNGWAIFVHSQQKEVLRWTPRWQGSPGQVPIPALHRNNPGPHQPPGPRTRARPAPTRQAPATAAGAGEDRAPQP